MKTYRTIFEDIINYLSVPLLCVFLIIIYHLRAVVDSDFIERLCIVDILLWHCRNINIFNAFWKLQIKKSMCVCVLKIGNERETLCKTESNQWRGMPFREYLCYFLHNVKLLMIIIKILRSLWHLFVLQNFYFI